MGRPPRGIPGNPGRPDLCDKDEDEHKDTVAPKAHFDSNFSDSSPSQKRCIPGENACRSAKASHQMSLCHGVARGQGWRERRPGGAPISLDVIGQHVDETYYF